MQNMQNISDNMQQYAPYEKRYFLASPRSRRGGAIHSDLRVHLESYTPGQDQAKSYVPVCTSMYWYMPVHASTGIFVMYRYVLVHTRNMT
jgi:hypothetical protein